MKDKTFFHKTCYRNDWQHLSKIEYLYSLVAQTVKNLPAVQETWVRSLDGEGPLEESMATHSNILAWKIP